MNVKQLAFLILMVMVICVTLYTAQESCDKHTNEGTTQYEELTLETYTKDVLDELSADIELLGLTSAFNNSSYKIEKTKKTEGYYTINAQILEDGVRKQADIDISNNLKTPLLLSLRINNEVVREINGFKSFEQKDKLGIGILPLMVMVLCVVACFAMVFTKWKESC